MNKKGERILNDSILPSSSSFSIWLKGGWEALVLVVDNTPLVQQGVYLIFYGTTVLAVASAFYDGKKDDLPAQT